MVTALDKKRIILGVSGGIAAYKSPELVRELRRAGAEVRVVMTGAAKAFVTPLALQSVSGHPVHDDLMDPAQESGMGHIELARWADLIVIAPTTADLMARLAHGFADDLLTTLCLATEAPLVLAPAMNHVMWEHPATRRNYHILSERGIRVIGPEDGDQACGETGPGRMMEPADIAADLAERMTGPDLRGLRFLVSAGPTREAVDPVRFFSNRSSGKMGFAIAAAAADMGAEVTLVAGPVNLPTPRGVERIDVINAAEMSETILDRANGADVFISTAAVADYRPETSAAEKLKKTPGPQEIKLIPNPDILAEVAWMENAPFTVGFAAETGEVVERAEEKRRRKGVDMICANDVSTDELGMESDYNAITVLWEGHSREIGPGPKNLIARELVGLISDALAQNRQPRLPTTTAKG